MNLLEQLQQTHISKEEISAYNLLLEQYREVCAANARKTEELRSMSAVVGQLDSFRQKFGASLPEHLRKSPVENEHIQDEIQKLEAMDRECIEQLEILGRLQTKFELLQEITS